MTWQRSGRGGVCDEQTLTETISGMAETLVVFWLKKKESDTLVFAW